MAILRITVTSNPAISLDVEYPQNINTMRWWVFTLGVAVEGLLKLNKSLPDQTPRCKINQQDIF